jgi:hypothetical protein
MMQTHFRAQLRTIDYRQKTRGPATDYINSQPAEEVVEEVRAYLVS